MEKIVLNNNDVYAILNMARYSIDKVNPISIVSIKELLVKIYNKSQNEDVWQYLVEDIIADYDKKAKKK